MDLYKHLLDALPVEPVPVQNVIVGVHWTMVCSSHCGLASTLTNCGPHGHARMRDVGKLEKMSAQELAERVYSDNMLEASVAIAAINSLIKVGESKLVTKNASEVIVEEGPGKNVAIVGHFPFVEDIKAIPKNTWVIEKRPYGDDFPEEAAEEYIPQADIVAITGTAFINHSMEKLVSLCRKDAKVLILGPSTPLIPTLFDFGISFLSGAVVDEPDTAMHSIIQGASLPQVNGIRLVTMTR